MRQLLDAMDKAGAEKNWYAALALALTLPDICGRLSDPTIGSASRSIKWFDAYARAAFTSVIGDEQTVFLSGADCYALRCAVLHEGRDEIVEQKAREALDQFILVAESGMHLIQIERRLLIDVGIFCQEIKNAVERWLEDNDSNPEIQRQLQGMMLISVDVRSVSIDNSDDPPILA